MKILIIYPYPLFDRSQEEDICVVPIGVYYVGAVLKKEGYDVEILNWYNIHKSPHRIVETFRAKKPDVIGFSILNANRWGGIELAQIAKELDPQVKVIFGGVGATFLWRHFLTHFSVVDFVVIGEGEYAFLNLVQVMEQGGEEQLQNIRGIAFRRGSRIVRTEAANPIDHLDELPIPAAYFRYQHVASSRGCPGKCTFCGSPKFWGHRVRLRSADNFVEELELLYHQGLRFFYFSDDTFTVNKARVVEICKAILKRGLKIVWVAISRADYVNETILYWMRMAGCIQISYGVESGSERIRGLLNKRLKTDDIKKAFSLTHRYGILARAYFIYGCPEETKETIEATIDMIRQIRPFICVFYILEIYPGTKLYADYQKKSHVTDDIWLKKMEGLCYFESDPHLSQALIMDFGKQLRTGFYTSLSTFAEALDLIDEKPFYEMHADFCSRLAMTFSQGDYANNEAIIDKEKAAERLFNKALSYAPDHRAYLGLAVLKQNEKEYQRAVDVLSEGVRHFPGSEQLNLCLGINYMNVGEYEKALGCFRQFEGSKEAIHYMAICYRALGDGGKAEALLKKAHR